MSLEDEQPGRALPLRGSLPAWFGSGGLVVLVFLQAIGIDPSMITGKGVSGHVQSIETRIDRLWTETNIQRSQINELESDRRILFERTDNASRDRTEIKATLKEMASSMAIMAQGVVRIETKLDGSRVQVERNR